MKVTHLSIPEVVLLEPKVFGDDRGFFFESFNLKKFEDATGQSPVFVQDNHSKSSRGVLRGLHYQLPPRAQDKLVRVVQGKVLDVAVDIRKNSPTYGQWAGAVLSGENKKQMWVPAGFAHGFITLSETAEFLYKTTDYYSPENERCIKWDDAELGIDWQYDEEPLISLKDQEAPSFSRATVYD